MCVFLSIVFFSSVWACTKCGREAKLIHFSSSRSSSYVIPSSVTIVYLNWKFMQIVLPFEYVNDTHKFHMIGFLKGSLDPKRCIMRLFLLKSEHSLW